MNGSLHAIGLAQLAVGLIPVAAVLVILWRWSLGCGNALYAIVRMLVQLLLVGFVLTSIFESNSPWIVTLVLAIMLASASWIALRTAGGRRRRLYGRALMAISIGGGVALVFVTQGVLRLDPWFTPRYVVPLGGMVFANAMNSVSLAAERFYAERGRGEGWVEARGRAMKAALIPITNSLFAVGLVSLPGIMTGQILSGVSPLIAVRYQIVVMCMVFTSAGLSAAVFLAQLARLERTETEAGARQRSV